MGNAVKKSMLFILLDESGSMAGLRSDVIKGINTFIEEQRKLPDPAVIAIANFGSHIAGMIQFIRPMVNLKEVALLTESDYRPTGGTPLLDATGHSIQTLDTDWAREKPDRCVFVTFTDGEENASKEFTVTKIKSLIQAREKSGLWLFQFLGANIDSFKISEQMGYSASHTANYTASQKGLAGATYGMSASVGTLRSMDAGAYAAAAAGCSDIGLGGDLQDDGSVTNKVDVKVTAASHPGFGDMDGKVGALGAPNTQVDPAALAAFQGFKDAIDAAIPPKTAIPPAASMAQESWTPPTSSALFDPKVDAWKPPV